MGVIGMQGEFLILSHGPQLAHAHVDLCYSDMIWTERLRVLCMHSELSKEIPALQCIASIDWQHKVSILEFLEPVWL